MNTIVMNFDDSIDINVAYNQLRKIYPKSRITKTDLDVNEMIENEWLLALAEEREKNGSGIVYTMEEVMARHNITQEDLDAAEEDEFE